MRNLLLPLLLCFGLSLFSFPAKGQEFWIQWAPHQVPELFSPLRFDLLITEKGKSRSLDPEDYELIPSWGWVRDGYFYFEEKDRALHRGQLTYLLRYRGAAHEGRDSLPYLLDIRLHPYTDSIKPVMDFYLPVEGRYSSGKIYPLDSSRIRLKASWGQIQAMSWAPGPKDSARSVVFEAVYRYDSTIRTTITLPLRRHWKD